MTLYETAPLALGVCALLPMVALELHLMGTKPKTPGYKLAVFASNALWYSFLFPWVCLIGSWTGQLITMAQLLLEA